MNNFLCAIFFLVLIPLAFQGCKDESTSDYKKLDALTITLVKATSATEGNPVSFKLFFQKHSDAETVLTYEVAGSGANPVVASDLLKGFEKSSFIVPPGSDSYTFFVDTIDDELLESAEEVAVTFHAAQNIMSTATINNQPANEVVLSISPDSPLNIPFNSEAVLTLALSQAAASAITVQYTLSNKSTTEEVKISQGESSANITIDAINDATISTITLTLISVSVPTVNLDPNRSTITMNISRPE